MTAPRFQVTGRFVLISLVTFFLVIFGVNATFITVAARSFPGLVTDQPFKRGLAPDYNATLAERAVQLDRGWTAYVEALRDPATGTVQIVLEMRNAEDTGVDGLTIAGELTRVVATGDDAAVTFTQIEPGVYAAAAADMEAGRWRLALETTFPDGAPFRATKDLWLP